jgi:predicted transcriptional regulator
MTITLSLETQKLLEERMKAGGFQTADDALRAVLQNQPEMEIDDRSPETLAAIREGIADLDAGRSRPWDEVERDLIARRSMK